MRGADGLYNACAILYGMAGDQLVGEYRPSTIPYARNGEHSTCHSKVDKLCEKKLKAHKVSFDAIAALTPAKFDDHVDSYLLQDIYIKLMAWS
jgi:hypothetical protein